MSVGFNFDRFTLMFADKEVMYIDIRSGRYLIKDYELVPYGLRNELIKVDASGDVDEIANSLAENSNIIRTWFARRALSLSRTNADKIYNFMGVDRLDNIYDKFRFVILCRAVSVLDKYWVRGIEEDVCWEDVNVKTNSLNNAIAQVALHGSSLTFQGSLTTPELTTSGMFAKAWKRHDDGLLWLHKLSSKDGNESEKEVMVSNILDKCNVDHVHYESGYDGGKFVCMCPCITDKYSIVSFHEFSSYCNSRGISNIDEIINIDSDNYYKMHIVDYLISNNDRHGYNWGLFVDDDLHPVSLHPLFDHNKSFGYTVMGNPKLKYKCSVTSMIRKAHIAIENVDFHFTAPILRSDFLKQEYYDCFMERAEELGIKTVVSPFASAVSKM